MEIYILVENLPSIRERCIILVHGERAVVRKKLSKELTYIVSILSNSGENIEIP